MLRERERVQAFLCQAPDEGSAAAETLTALLTLAPPAAVVASAAVAVEAVGVETGAEVVDV